MAGLGGKHNTLSILQKAGNKTIMKSSMLKGNMSVVKYTEEQIQTYRY